MEQKNKVVDKEQYQVTDGKKVPFKTMGNEPSGKTRGQYAVQVKKVPFKGVFAWIVTGKRLCFFVP